jgi:hypothetical protein
VQEASADVFHAEDIEKRLSIKYAEVRSIKRSQVLLDRADLVFHSVDRGGFGKGKARLREWR